MIKFRIPSIQNVLTSRQFSVQNEYDANECHLKMQHGKRKKLEIQ